MGLYLPRVSGGGFFLVSGIWGWWFVRWNVERVCRCHWSMENDVGRCWNCLLVKQILRVGADCCALPWVTNLIGRMCLHINVRLLAQWIHSTACQNRVALRSDCCVFVSAPLMPLIETNPLRMGGPLCSPVHIRIFRASPVSN